MPGFCAEIIVLMRFWAMLLAFAWIGAAQQYPFVLVPGTPPNTGVSFQDHLGRLWWASAIGPQYFDGGRFFSLQQAGFTATFTRSFGSVFAEDDDGGIWFVSGQGVYRFADGRLERMIGGSAESVVRVAPGVLLASIGSDSGLFLYRFRKQGTAWNVDQLSDWQARSQGRVTVDHHGNAVFACPGAWCELPRDAIVNWHPGLQVQPIRHPDVYPGIEIILRDSAGCVWFRSPGGAKYQCPGDAEPKQLPLEVASNGVGMEEAFDGSIVIVGYLGVAIGRPGHFLIINSQNGMPSLGSGFLARDGTLWVGAQKGLYRCSYLSRLEFWTEREGVSASFSILRTGRKTFASSGLGIAVLDEDRSRWLPLKATRELGVVRNIQRGPGNTLMAVSHHNAVAQVSFDGRILARSAPGADPEAMQLAQTPDGQWWLAGSGVGRIEFHGSQLKIIPEILPPPLTFGTDIEYEPHTHKLWACYAGGLIVKEGASWRRITKSDALLENGCRTLVPLPNGDVWYGYFATRAFALVRTLSSGKILVRQYRGSKEGDPLRLGYSFSFDLRNWLWLGSGAGVLAADPAQAEEAIWTSLNEDDGLPGTGVNQQSFRNDPDGSVWWAADNAIIHFSPPADFVHPTFSPSVFVSGFSWNGVAPKMAILVHQIPHGSDITAHVGSLQFDRRNNLRVRYRLLPSQQQWREGRDLDVKLGEVPWGAHTLEVQARLLTGPWSGVQRHSFSVLPPFWFTWRFLLAALLSFCILFALLYRAKKKRQELQKRSLPDLDDLRLLALSPEAHDVVGTVLDSRYEAGRVLARGGFATVLKGRDLQREGRACAIKVFRE
jgi:ligand-binding sensor domain-containing protein